jgi:hypothetical protein
MSALLEVTDQLQETEAAIRQLEQAIAQQTPTPSIIATLSTLQKRQRDLEAQFNEATAEKHLDVCRYRLFPDQKENERPTLAALTKTLYDFQALVTQVYAAIKRELPKPTTHVSAEEVAATQFGYNYSFSGSVGVVLTLPNERLLFGETDLDRAINTVFEMSKANTSEKVQAYAKQLGAGPVRTLYKWVSDQVVSGLSSEIEWRRNQEVRSEVIAQWPELESLKRAIEATSEEEQTPLITTGYLVGADFKSRTFHMAFESGPDVRGKMSDAINEITWPKIYTAKIIKTTKIFYSTDKPVEFYYLESLSE